MVAYLHLIAMRRLTHLREVLEYHALLQVYAGVVNRSKERSDPPNISM